MMDRNRLNRIIEKHERWLKGQKFGERASFTGEDLHGMDISGKDLSKAGFVNCNLTGANLSNSIFNYANFTNANFTNATTTGANFENAIFHNTEAVPASFPIVVPETGEFTAYKKVKTATQITKWNESKCKNEYSVDDSYYIAKLTVPADAKRSNGAPQIRYYSSYDSYNEYTTNTIELTKCRVSHARVDGIYYMNGKLVDDTKLSCVSCIYEGTKLTDETAPQYWKTLSQDEMYMFDDYKVIFEHCKIKANTSSMIRIRMYFDEITDLDSLDTTTNSEYPENNYRYNIFYNTVTHEAYQWYPSTSEWKEIESTKVKTSLDNLSKSPYGLDDGKIIITYSSTRPNFSDIDDCWVDKNYPLFEKVNLCKKPYYKTEYKKGRIVYSDYWDDDNWNICSHGIHCFLTFDQAKKYTYEDSADKTYLVNKLQNEIVGLVEKGVIPDPLSIKLIDEENLKKVTLNYGFEIDFYTLDYYVTDLNMNLQYGFAERDEESYFIDVYPKDSSIDYTLYDLQKDLRAIIDNGNITRPLDLITYSSTSSGAYVELKYGNDITASIIRADAATIQRMIQNYTYTIVSDVKAKTNKVILT